TRSARCAIGQRQAARLWRADGQYRAAGVRSCAAGAGEQGLRGRRGGARNAASAPGVGMNAQNGEAVQGSMPSSRRGLARRLTVQALYQWLLNETPVTVLLKQFREQDEGLGRADPLYFEELLNGVMDNAPELTLAIVPHLDRPLAQLD